MADDPHRRRARRAYRGFAEDQEPIRMSDDMHRTIGRLEEAVSTLAREQHALRKELAEVRTTLSEARGGWRTLMWLGGGAAAVGGAIGATLRQWAGL